MSGDAPDASDFSLVPLTDVVLAVLDARAPASVVEVGADRGDFTRELLAWAERTGARVTAIDPRPKRELIELADERPELTLIRERSLDALERLPAEAFILDGDHNYFTVSEELRLISGTDASEMPLVMLHDVGWPHAHRDTYYAPQDLPESERQPLARDVLLAPGVSGTASAGIPFSCAAEREGGPRNGVRTAVEDFLAAHEGVRFAFVPPFFGLGVLWPDQTRWSDAVAQVLEPWTSSPLLERLEANRVARLVERDRLRQQEELLRGLLGSRSFGLAARLARLRRGGRTAVDPERIRRALGD
jgi:hypothetical protein